LVSVGEGKGSGGVQEGEYGPCTLYT
jgi:hypothetical protein